jgi:ADP-ribose pyrophosphatase YjhB (NUDIX family)
MQLAILPPLRRTLRAEKAPDALREPLAELIESSALALLEPERLAARAEDLRLKERDRVHHAGLVVNAMVLSAMQRSTDTDGRLLDARRTYEALGGRCSGKTSFRNNVHQVVPLMQDVLRRRLEAMRAATRDVEMRGRLKAFSDVLIPDGCAFKVASALSNLYAGTSQPAELKLHAVYCVRAGGCTSVTLAPGSQHDSEGFWPTSWEKDALYLWDLGYVSHERFIDAVQGGAQVIQRLKEGMNPVVLASYGPEGARRELFDEAGQRLRLQEACAFGHVHKQRVLDLEVQITDRHHRTVTARLVCVPFGGEDRYYLATLPRALFTPHDIAELYRIRWEVELFFRGWRGALRLDEVRRLQHPLSLQAVVLASLLAAVLAQQLSVGLDQLAAAQAAQEAAFSP